jgi:hypothetical protein
VNNKRSLPAVTIAKRREILFATVPGAAAYIFSIVVPGRLRIYFSIVVPETVTETHDEPVNN